MFNKVILIGNLTRDLELRYMPNGGAVCSTGIATNRKFTKKDGTSSEEVCFIDVTFFGRTAEIANQYLAKGRRVMVEGRLKLDQWTDQNGGKRSKHSVVVENMQMLSAKGETNEYDSSQQNYDSTNQQSYKDEQKSYTQSAPQHNGNDTPVIDIDEDEIPF